jgi:hypothetical protein
MMVAEVRNAGKPDTLERLGGGAGAAVTVSEITFLLNVYLTMEFRTANCYLV